MPKINVKESITNPTDKIALPDSKRDKKFSEHPTTNVRYDDESLLDLNSDNQHIMMEQLKQISLRQAVLTHTHTHTVSTRTKTPPCPKLRHHLHHLNRELPNANQVHKQYENTNLKQNLK
jgi:hypothetical protein